MIFMFKRLVEEYYVLKSREMNRVCIYEEYLLINGEKFKMCDEMMLLKCCKIYINYVIVKVRNLIYFILMNEFYLF